MFKKLFNSKIFGIIILIVIVLLIQHFYLSAILVRTTLEPLEASRVFVQILFEHSELDKLDDFMTNKLVQKMKKDNTLEKFKKEPTTGLVYNNRYDIQPMLLLYINEFTTISAVGFLRNNSVKNSYIMMFRLEKKVTQTWLQNLMFWKNNYLTTWKIDDYYTTDEIEDIEMTENEINKMFEGMNLSEENIEQYEIFLDKFTRNLMVNIEGELKEIYEKHNSESPYSAYPW